MLVRLWDNEVHELPDAVGALVLSDPSFGDVETDFSSNDVNTVIHGVLGLHFDEALSLEDNIDNVRKHFAKIPPATKENIALAKEQVRKYNEEVGVDDVGNVDLANILP